MKKMNAKGFTLIELLAVITIMGILMIVAIPAVTRTIENTRKDTFVNTVQNYVNGLQTMWASDNLSCVDRHSGEDFVSSAVSSGFYYVEVDSASTSVPQLLESGGKSPWGSRHMKGYILIHVYDVDKTGAGGEILTTRKIDYYPVMSDDIHGVNATAGNGPNTHPAAKLKKSENLKRGDLQMSGLTYAKAGWTEGNSVVPKGWSGSGDSSTYNASDSTVSPNAGLCVEV